MSKFELHVVALPFRLAPDRRSTSSSCRFIHSENVMIWIQKMNLCFFSFSSYAFNSWEQCHSLANRELYATWFFLRRQPVARWRWRITVATTFFVWFVFSLLFSLAFIVVTTHHFYSLRRHTVRSSVSVWNASKRNRCATNECWYDTKEVEVVEKNARKKKLLHGGLHTLRGSCFEPRFLFFACLANFQFSYF